MDALNTQSATPQETTKDIQMGRIISVTGAQAVVLLDQSQGNLGVDERPEMGTLLKVDTPDSTVLGLICALAVPMPSQEPDGGELRISEVEFIGELLKDENGVPQVFKRGVSNYPGLGDIVHRASQDELSKAYSCEGSSAIRPHHCHGHGEHRRRQLPRSCAPG